MCFECNPLDKKQKQKMSDHYINRIEPRGLNKEELFNIYQKTRELYKIYLQ